MSNNYFDDARASLLGVDIACLHTAAVFKA
jgi:hypothetical protein